MEKIYKLFKSSSFRVSVFYYIGSLFSNFGGYLFHLILLRLLIPSVYGEFLTLISFLYLLAIPSSTISILVTKFVANYHGKNQITTTNYFFYQILKSVIVPLSIIGVSTIIFSPIISPLFKTNSAAFVILGINVIISLLSSVIRSFILGFQMYIFNTFITIIETMLKIIFAFIFISLGFAATGGVIAILLTGLISFIVCFLKIRQYIYPKTTKKQKINLNLKKILTYSLIYSAGTLSLLSTDVILVRYFFDAHNSGIYSGLSMLGRIIFYGSTPFVGFLIPYIANRYSSKRSVKPPFFKLGSITIIFGIISATAMSLFPKFFITLISGEKYLENIPLLPIFSLTMLLFSLNYFLLTFLVSINKNKANYFLLTASILQVVLILFFHKSLHQIVQVNLLVQLLLLISLFIFYKIKTNNVQ